MLASWSQSTIVVQVSWSQMRQFAECRLNDVQDHLSLGSWKGWDHGSCQIWAKSNSVPSVDSDISGWRKGGWHEADRALTGRILALAGVPSPEVNVSACVVFPRTREHLLTFCFWSPKGINISHPLKPTPLFTLYKQIGLFLCMHIICKCLCIFWL